LGSRSGVVNFDVGEPGQEQDEAGSHFEGFAELRLVAGQFAGAAGKQALGQSFDLAAFHGSPSVFFSLGTKAALMLF
jgi:hypothetical protein